MKSIVACAAAALLLTGCITVHLGDLGVGPLEERVIYGEKGKKILLLDIDGTLSERGERGTLGIGKRPSIVAQVREELEQASKDDDIRALLLRINSPGGTVTASEIVYGEIERFKQETGLPVVAQMMGLAASGGYYVAMSADHVQAYATSVTGSIGVILAGLNVSGLMEKAGVENQTIVTGPFKDAGSPFRPMRDAEEEQLESILDDLFARFLEVVERGRPGLSRAQVEAAADGRIFSAGQALEVGLVDSIGDLPAAVDLARERAGLDDARVVVYRRPGQRATNLFSSEGPSVPRVSGAEALLLELARPAFLYLWAPALGLGPAQ